jgi:chemotaxis methyl-accepting protein methylase
LRELAPADIELFREWLSREAGLKGEDYRDAFLARRIQPRIEAHGFTSVGGYLKALKAWPSEREMLLSRVLVPTTEFMRNPEVWASLGRLLMEAPFRDPLRIASAPCSTGEEAFSAAILMEELNRKGTVVAADRSPRALARLAEARYPERALEKLDKNLVWRYFKTENGWATPVQRVRRKVFPLLWDIGNGIPGSGFHAVLVRNLFIYLTQEAQERVIKAAGTTLEPGGFLVLGRVERMPQGLPGWEKADGECRIYRWKGGIR